MTQSSYRLLLLVDLRLQVLGARHVLMDLTTQLLLVVFMCQLCINTHVRQ